jgi:hypothetical protein
MYASKRAGKDRVTGVDVPGVSRASDPGAPGAPAARTAR